ncbi:MAG: flagellar M-ring protein FliF, partial [Pararhodobacter sp.]|nr:flagellar M-ring protein FliF [Pararhodobacter sp.]
ETDFPPRPALAGLPGPTEPVLTGEIDDDEGAGAATARKTAETPINPVDRMRALIAERQDETLEILRHWMEEPEEPR